MNPWLENWQPIVKDVNERDLVMEEGSIKTVINVSEGDALFIHQENWSGKQVIALSPTELYNIIFNFMSQEELVNLAVAKAKHSVGVEK